MFDIYWIWTHAVFHYGLEMTINGGSHLRDACRAPFTHENFMGNFKNAEVPPFNPQVVIEKLDIKVWMPTSAGTSSANAES